MLLQRQLESAGITMEGLLHELRPLFLSGDYPGRYAVWLLHREYTLEEGERMVMKNFGDTVVTRPEIFGNSEVIVPERWNFEGEDVVHRCIDFSDDGRVIERNTPSPPSEFLAEFRSILERRDVNVLGVCFAPSRKEGSLIEAGFNLTETFHIEDRSTVVTITHTQEANNGLPLTSWVPGNVTKVDVKLLSLPPPDAGVEDPSDRYNRLPRVGDSRRALDEQLQLAGLTLEDLLKELQPVFSNTTINPLGKYAVWLLHRHFTLVAGEWIVSENEPTETQPFNVVTRVERDVDPEAIIAERWDFERNPEEYRVRHGEDNSPPLPELFERFEEVMKAQGAGIVKFLGICLAPTLEEAKMLTPGNLFLERTDYKARINTTTICPRPTGDTVVYDTTWILAKIGEEEVDIMDMHPGTEIFSLSCKHSCIGGVNH